MQKIRVWGVGDISKNAYYNTPHWRRLREMALARDNYLCVYCLRAGRIVPATTVHHIKPIDEFPKFANCLENIVSLCAMCHNRAHPEKPGKGCGRPAARDNDATINGVRIEKL